MAYLSVCHTDNLPKQLEDAKKITNEISSLCEKAKTDIEGKVKETDRILTKAREVAGSESAQAFAKVFKEVADDCQNASKHWLWVTGIVAAVTLGAAIWGWYSADKPSDGNNMLQKMSSKLVIMATLLTGTFWCGKNYKALRHLAVVNRHREVSIKTLQSFSDAASDPHTKDAVLLEATRAAFGSVPTGYINDGGAESELKVVEIARNICSKSDK